MSENQSTESLGYRTAVRFAWVALLIAFDLASKRYVFAWLEAHHGLLSYDNHGHLRFEIVGHTLAFMQSWNRGMAWGIALPAVVLIGGRAIASAFLVYLLLRTPSTQKTLVAALVLILAGALGNLHDNLFMPRPDGWPIGEVRDFIDVYFGGRIDWHFPTFNIADSCITVGAVFLFASGVFGGEKKLERGLSEA